MKDFIGCVQEACNNSDVMRDANANANANVAIGIDIDICWGGGYHQRTYVPRAIAFSGPLSSTFIPFRSQSVSFVIHFLLRRVYFSLF